METQLRENIHWVGFVDWNVRDFHSYDTHRGATYNAYLIQDEKTALIDTVKGPYANELLQNISRHTDPKSIDYVVCNHAEPDHSSALPAIMRAAPNATLVCSPKCVPILEAYFDTSDWKIQVVKEGDTISLGNRTLQFIMTPMVHWPDSMFTYVPEEKLLFSMDGFGQHFATSHRFDDENNLEKALHEAETYYANIVTPFGCQVVRTFEKVAGVPIEMIAPSHGVIWRSHIPEILAAYKKWATGRLDPKVLIIYDSMWESTSRMAEAICDGATINGVDVRIMHVRRCSLTEIATEALSASGVAFGSATLNRSMMPAAAAALNYIKGLNPPPKACFAFGSYGWGIGGPEHIHEALVKMKWETTRDFIKAKFRPTEEILDLCREAGRELAEAALAKCAASRGE